MIKYLVDYKMSGKITYPVNDDIRNGIICMVGDSGVAGKRMRLVELGATWYGLVIVWRESVFSGA